jgi:pyruvate/2-oxoglutarate dehydrogenase complex dihydrolipoamide dehydrogenase (E3) component
MLDAPDTVIRQSRRPYSAVPEDEHERERLSNVHPPQWQNPKPAGRYSLVIIGAGTAGQVAAYEAAALGAKVALVDHNLYGGNCLNIGCVPSKAIIRTSRLYAEMRNAAQYGGIRPADIRVDFATVMERMRAIRARMSRAASVSRLVQANVDVFFGHARFTGEDSLAVDETPLRFRKAIIATGARPDTPAVAGLDESGYLTNETVFNLTEAPRRLLVIGGGPLGCEMAQAFCRLGVRTTIVEDHPLFLPREERDAAQILADSFARDGMEVRLNTKAVSVRVERGEKFVDVVSDDHRTTFVTDAILTGAGRVPAVDGLNLEAAGVEFDDVVGVHVNDFLRSANRRIYAAGDACLVNKFNHTAEATGRMAARNALLSHRERVSDLVIPWCTYTDPEIAHVGMYVREAMEKEIPVKTFTIPMHEVSRAITDDDEIGFVKIHVRERTDRILGATIVARHAGEMINEITLAMVAGVGLSTIARTIHSYGTQAEGIKLAADAYLRTRGKTAVP